MKFLHHLSWVSWYTKDICERASTVASKEATAAFVLRKSILCLSADSLTQGLTLQLWDRAPALGVFYASTGALAAGTGGCRMGLGFSLVSFLEQRPALWPLTAPLSAIKPW